MITSSPVRHLRFWLEHRIEFTPSLAHPDLAFPDSRSSRAACSCGAWASDRSKSRREHARSFDRHVNQARALAKAVPPEYGSLVIVPLRCINAEHAEAVVRECPEKRSQEQQLFVRRETVFIAYRDSDFPCSVAVWAHGEGHATDVYAGRVLRDVT